MKNIFFILLLFAFIQGSSQVSSKTDFSKRKFEDKMSSWSPKQLNSANTFHKISYLTLDEKMVIFYINLARIDSKLFSKTILKDYQAYLDSTGGSNPNLASLKRDLAMQKSVKPLVPQKDLYQLAKNYAIFQGKTGQTGSTNFIGRVKKLCQTEKYLEIKELLYYSKKQPLDVAFGILTGYSEYGAIPADIVKKERKLIFKKNINTIGLSLKKHSEYEHVCVFEIGEKDYSPKIPLTPKEKKELAEKQRKLDYKNRKRLDRGKEAKKAKTDKRKMNCDGENKKKRK